MRRGTAIATSITMIMRMLLTPVSTPCAQDTVFFLLNPITEPLPRDGCRLGVHSHRSILSASYPLAPLLPRLLLPLAQPVGTPQPTCRAANPGRMRHTHPPHLAGRPPSTHPQSPRQPPATSREADLVSRFTLSLLSAHPSHGVHLLLFTFSATWLPSFTSATFVYPCLKSNFFCLLSPFQMIPYF